MQERGELALNFRLAKREREREAGEVTLNEPVIQGERR